MYQTDTLETLHKTIFELVERAKVMKHAVPGIKTPDCLAGVTLAHDLGTIGQEFINLSVALKQAARTAANESVRARSTQANRMTAAHAADKMVRNGAYRVIP